MLARAPSSTHHHALITPALQSLHWLEIIHRIQYKVISITYNVLYNFEPTYLGRLITPQSHGSTRSADCLFLCLPPLSSRLKFSDRSFQNAPPYIWNNLSPSLRSYSSCNCTSTTTLLSTTCTLLSPVPFQSQE